MDFFSVWYFLIFVIALAYAKDYYDLLRIGRQATDAEIKRAFRRLALQYHPDRNKEKDAEVKFREIAEAYEILSDPEKRQKYDQYGESAFKHDEEDDDFDFDIREFFKHFDESFKHRQDGGNSQHTFHNGHFTINLDDLWNDNERLVFEGGFHYEDGEEPSIHDFGDMFGDGSSFFGQDHDHHHSVRESSYEYSNSDGSSGGKRCRTVTQKIGDMTTVITECG